MFTQKMIFLTKLTKIESYSQVSAQNQTTEGFFKKTYKQNYEYATTNWLLLVTKTSNWWTKLINKKLEN